VLGRESAGTPRELYAQMDATITIPMRDGARSLNVAMSAGMLVAEAGRQMKWSMA
jgi:tRNA (cytidine/uridine-2'-O-)-methyltransferase